MEVDELPQFDPNVDYNVILPIQQKRTIAFINHFILNTVSFLNKFAESCESRLLQFEYKLQKVEASLLILESQLASIPNLQVSEKGSEINKIEQTESVLDSLDLPEIASEDTPEINDKAEVVNNEIKGPIACADLRFSKFFKMVQFGVPPQAVKLKMESEGVDANILDKPNDIIPGWEIPQTNDVSDISTD